MHNHASALLQPPPVTHSQPLDRSGNTVAPGEGAASCDRCDTPTARCAFANAAKDGCIDPAIRIARDGAVGISCPLGGLLIAAGRAGTTHECGVALPDLTSTVSRQLAIG